MFTSLRYYYVTLMFTVQVTLIITTKLLLIQSDLVSLSLTIALPKALQVTLIITIIQVTLIIDQTIDTIVTSSSPLAVSKAISAS